jgi:hypothetical protein
MLSLGYLDLNVFTDLKRSDSASVESNVHLAGKEKRKPIRIVVNEDFAVLRLARFRGQLRPKQRDFSDERWKCTTRKKN